jgi:chromosome segregation ATPase
MLGRLVKDLEDQLATALKTKSQADMMLQAQKSSHEKEVEKLNTAIDGLKKEYEELKEQNRAEKDVLGRMIKDVEEQCATAISEKGHLEAMLNQATGDRSDLEFAREEYKAMVDEIRQDKENAIQTLRNEKDYLAREIRTQEDLIAEKDAKIKTLEENNSVLQTSQLQLNDLHNEYQTLARDFHEVEVQLKAARKRLSEVEEELAENQKATADQMNELRYQLVHARADKEEVVSKSEHDKAKMYGILKELEAQLREATGGEPGANVTRMMGEFTETMGQPPQSDGNLFASMKEYEDKLIAAEQEAAELRNQLRNLQR